MYSRKLTALGDGTEKQLRAEIIKIHSDDEVQRTTAVSIVNIADSPEVAKPVEESQPDVDDWENDDNYSRFDQV